MIVNLKMYIMEKEKLQTLKKNLLEHQLNAGKTYMQYEQDKYSAYQNYLYKRALYGLDSLTEQELATMCSKKKQRIINVFKRAQVVLNVAKQKATIAYTNALFKTLFPNSPITEFLLSETEPDPSFKNTLTFKELGISKDSIVELFISEGILPKNFLSLEQPNSLPRLRNSNN